MRPRGGRGRREAAHERVEIGHRRAWRHLERQQREAGHGSHGGEIARVDGEAAAAEGPRGEPGTAEVDPFDERVRGEDEGSTPRAYHRGIVARSDDDAPACTRGRQASDPVMQPDVLAHVPEAPH